MTFETGLCACMEDKASCLDVICCWACQTGRQWLAVQGQVNNMSVGICCLSLFGFHSLFAPLLRCKVSDRYNLGEGCCGSLFFGCLCTYCSLCQTHRQLTLRNEFPGGVCVSQAYTTRMS